MKQFASMGELRSFTRRCSDKKLLQMWADVELIGENANASVCIQEEAERRGLTLAQPEEDALEEFERLYAEAA